MQNIWDNDLDVLNKTTLELFSGCVDFIFYQISHHSLNT